MLYLFDFLYNSQWEVYVNFEYYIVSSYCNCMLITVLTNEGMRYGFCRVQKSYRNIINCCLLTTFNIECQLHCFENCFDD